MYLTIEKKFSWLGRSYSTEGVCNLRVCGKPCPCSLNDNVLLPLFVCNIKTGREDEATLCKMFLESQVPGIQKLTDDSKLNDNVLLPLFVCNIKNWEGG